MNLATVPSVLGVIALAFLALLFVKVALQPAMDKPAKHLLLAGMLAMAFCLFYIYAGMNRDWPRLASIEIGLAWWIGPSLYFYIRRLNGSAEPFLRRWYWQWVPAIAIEILLLPFFLRNIPGRADLLGIPLNVSRQIVGYVWMGFHLQLTLYILLALPQLRAYRRRLTDNYSDLSVLNLRWLTFCCCGFLGVILAERLLPAIGVTSTSLSQTAGSTVYLFVIVLMSGALGHSRLALASATRPEPAAPAIAGAPAVEFDVRQVEKYSRSRLRDDSAQYYLSKLQTLMATERAFLESDLSLQSLAGRIKLSPHHLSQILNEKLHKNFYDYINEQRVEHARQLLQEPQATITGVAFDSGFNSKNSFYNAFRRHAGMSPSEFRRKAGAAAS